MIEISGINERLAALDQVIVAAKQHIVEQKGIAQGFVRNQETAQDLSDVAINRDALLTLCESHVTQLQIMQANESATHEGMRKCETAKIELAQNLHTRLRWLYFVQRTILNADVKLSMFREQLNQLCNQMEFLSQVQQAPDIYLSLVRECVRRQNFSQKFSQWSDEVLTSFKVVRDREIFRRKSFKHKIGNHFIQKLFPGLSDRPPVISRKPLRKFDMHIPSISSQDMQSLRVVFPDNELELCEEEFPTCFDQSWQITVAASVTKSLTMRSCTTLTPSTPPGSNQTVTSSHHTHLDETPSTSTIIATGAGSHVFQTGGPDPEQPRYSPGGFVASSVHGLSGQEILDKMDHHSIVAMSPPRLASPPSCDEFEVGSPADSEEFFSVQAVTPKSEFVIMPEMFPSVKTTDEQHLTSDAPPSTMTEVFTMDKKDQRFTQTILSEEDMFHSLSSTTDQHQVLEVFGEDSSIGSIKDDAQAAKLISDLQTQIKSMKENRDGMVHDFESRWQSSRNELENVIQQLESEKKERKAAWEKEVLLTKQLEDVQSQLKQAKEEVESVRVRLGGKIRLCEELQSKFNAQQNNVEIKIASATEKFHREMSEKDAEINEITSDMTLKLCSAQKELEMKSNDLKDAEDRIQELESQLSETESKIDQLNMEIGNHRTETQSYEDKVNDCKATELSLQSTIHTLTNDLDDIKGKLLKAEDQSCQLREMLAANELEFDQLKNSSSALAEKEQLLKAEMENNVQLNLKLDEKANVILSLEDELASLQKDLHKSSVDTETLTKELKMELEELKSKHQSEIDEIKEKDNEARNTLIVAHKKSLEAVKTDHDILLQRAIEEYDTKTEELKKTSGLELDELRADHLQEIMNLQKQCDELEQEYSKLRDEQQDEADRLLESTTSSCFHERYDASKRWQTTNDDVMMAINIPTRMVTSSVMSSSNEETKTKRSKMDQALDQSSNQRSLSRSMVSLHDHKALVESISKKFEDEKSLIQTSFRRREESATKRRQIMFNAAIQRVSVAKDEEIQKLKDQLMQKSSLQEASVIEHADDGPSSSKISHEKDRIAIANFQHNDIVLVIYDPNYHHYMLFTLGHQLYFLHNDSVTELGLTKADSKIRVLAKLLEKEYCQARKPSNRYNVEVGTKFYRVKLCPVHKKVPIRSFVT